MNKSHLLAAVSDFWDRVEGIFTNPVQLLVFAGVVIAIVLLFLWVRKNISHLQAGADQVSDRVRNLVNRGTHEARLNYAICPHCKKGRGILNPVQVMIENEPWIEGNCTSCGQFLRTPVK